jgi:hypothetical protein
MSLVQFFRLIWLYLYPVEASRRQQAEARDGGDGGSSERRL